MKCKVNIEFEVLIENIKPEDIKESVKEYIYIHLLERIEDNDIKLEIKEVNMN